MEDEGIILFTRLRKRWLSLSPFPQNTNPTRQCFVKNGCTEYYENPTDGLIDDARSTAKWVDRGTDVVCA